MNRSEHLTEDQLTEYFGDALEREAKHAIGRHLLLCDFCLRRLPQPTPEQFMAALMTENETEEDSLDERTISRVGFLAHLLKQPKIFALSAAGALAVALVFSAFIWLSAAKSSDMDRELAENFETPPPIFNQTSDEKINLPSVLPPAENDNSSPDVSTRVVSNRDFLAAKEIKPKQNSKVASRNDFDAKTQEKMPDGEKGRVSSTRGGASSIPKCADETAVETTVSANSDAVTLKWKKVPNAQKYHLYVSDDEEILLDEFETAQETVYVLKKPLDPLKTYKWKVVITLGNGETVTGDSRKFTVKDLQSNQKKSEKKGKSEIRCSESKLNR